MSYSLELDSKVPLCNLPSDDDWILNANYIDKTFMRHKISFDLFRAMNPNNRAPQVEYANVSLNGDAIGLYAIMEEINAGFLELTRADSMSVLFKGPPIFLDNPLDGVQDSSNYYNQKYPKSNKIRYRHYLDSFYHFIKTTDERKFVNEIEQWIDINNIIDWHLLLLLTNNSDGILKNFYLYKTRNEDPMRIAIWDYDHSFGRDGDNELNILERILDCRRSILFRRLLESPDLYYEALLKDRWHELRELGIFSHSYFSQQISQIRGQVKSSLQQNFEIWPLDSKHYFDANSFETEVQLIEEYLDLRFRQLDTRFKYEKDRTGR